MGLGIVLHKSYVSVNQAQYIEHNLRGSNDFAFYASGHIWCFTCCVHHFYVIELFHLLFASFYTLYNCFTCCVHPFLFIQLFHLLCASLSIFTTVSPVVCILFYLYNCFTCCLHPFLFIELLHLLFTSFLQFIELPQLFFAPFSTLIKTVTFK